MKRTFWHINVTTILLLFLPVFLQAEKKDFVLVIDAGHGGKDPGARGNLINEKVINLSVALKLGNLISENHDNIKVIYTRKTDRFIGLDERANIANRNKADLFISIHANAIEKAKNISGTETYILGLASSNENLEVAKRENSAILLEDNYLQKYENFDPNSTESYIIFGFMQNGHMEQSIRFASEIQRTFKTAKRNDRGVKQGGLLVLRRTSMPGVLIELGFITNPAEERYMKSVEGQNALAKAIYDAFLVYIHKYYERPAVATTATASPEPSSSPKKKETTATDTPKTSEDSSSAPAASAKATSKGAVVYKVQILTSKNKLPANSRQFKGYKNISFYEEDGLFKYTYGESSDLASIKVTGKKLRKDFKDAFIIAFKDGKKMK